MAFPLPRMSLFEKVQLGLEANRGTQVAANKLMTAMSINLSPVLEIQKFRPAGIKFTTTSVLNKESGRARVEGIPTYNEICYPLASIMGKTTPTGGGAAKTWVFGMNYSAPDDPATYTVEQGVAPNAMKAGYGLFNNLTVVAARGENSMTGEMMTQLVTDGITPTASPTTVPLVPMIGRNWDVFADDTSAGLGTTLLGMAFRAEMRISDRYRGVWPLRSDMPSFATHTEVEPTVQMMLRIQADADAVAMVEALKAGDSKYLRLISTSGDTFIEATTPYTFQVELNGIVTEVGELDDEDGVVSRDVTFDAKLDTGWLTGTALLVTVINTLTAL